MLNFFKLFFGESDATATRPPSTVDMQEAMIGLDIDTAKVAHENWKLRLLAYLEGQSSEDFAPEQICFDDRCDLGRWIHGQGRTQLGKFPGFTALTSHHRMFHYSASNVVALKKAGHTDQAKQMLGQQFSEYSKAVVQDLEMLQQIASAAARRRR